MSGSQAMHACLAAVWMMCILAPVVVLHAATAEVLTGLIVVDTETGKEWMFELLQRDAERGAAVADSFCAQLHLNSRNSCKQTINTHLRTAVGEQSVPTQHLIERPQVRRLTFRFCTYHPQRNKWW